MITSPLISIIVPVYNAENLIKKTIDSVVEQTYINWELILINDGSKDNTESIIKTYIENNNKIKYLYQDNLGPSAARNKGLEYVKGEYLTFVDADDFIDKKYLEKLYQPIKNNKKPDLVCAGYKELSEFHPKGIALHDFESFRKTKHLITQKEFTDNIFKGLTGVLWGKLFKTEIIRQYNIKMPEDLKLSEDLIFVVRYAKHVKNVALVFQNIYYYNRLNEGGLSRKFDQRVIPNIIRFNELIQQEKILPTKTLNPKLNKRTAYLLLKVLKDQASSVNNLKENFMLISKEFDIRIFKELDSKTDRWFVSLLRKGFFRLALTQNNVLNWIRERKHA